MHNERKAKVMEILDAKADRGYSFFLFFFFSSWFCCAVAASDRPDNKKRHSYSVGHNQSSAGRGILGIIRGDCLLKVCSELTDPPRFQLWLKFFVSFSPCD